MIEKEYTSEFNVYRDITKKKINIQKVSLVNYQFK